MTAPVIRPLLEDIQARITTLEGFVGALVKNQLSHAEERERLRADLRKVTDHATRLVAQKETLLAAIGRQELERATPVLHHSMCRCAKCIEKEPEPTYAPHDGEHQWYLYSVNLHLKIWRCCRPLCHAIEITAPNEKPK